MFINTGARGLLLQGERQKFLGEEWPRVYATIQRLGLKPEELLNGGATRGVSSRSGSGTGSKAKQKKDEER
jgi:GntR family transcriptional regulator